MMKKTFMKSAVVLGLALSLAFSPLSTAIPSVAYAHGGGEADYVPLKATLENFGAKVQWDAFTGTINISRDGYVVRVKPGSKEAIVNGKSIQLDAPVTLKKGVSYVSHHFINEVFQSGLEQTVKIEDGYHPFNPLTPTEIEEVVKTLKESGNYKEGLRFTEISVKIPNKEDVWDWVLNGNRSSRSFERKAEFIALDGKQVYEGEVNLTTRKLVSWEKIDDVHGMIILDDFFTAQEAIENSVEYAKALQKRGIDDVKKVVATPLTVGYFEGEDGLEQDLRLLKVVAYLNTGDGNFWAHPIENLVAIVDLEQKKVIKVEDEGIIPIPMQNNPYNGRQFEKKVGVKPLHITEPEGKNYRINGNAINWNNWDLHLRLDTRVGPILSTVTYNDQGKKRKIMYEGSLGGMIVPYGDPDVGWYFKAYLDSGDYGMGALTSSLVKGTDVPENAMLLDATIADNEGNPYTIPNAIAVFERYAGPEYRHDDLITFTEGNESRERRELVIRWVSTIGNYDYIFDWVLLQNGTMKIDIGASGIEAVKGVVTKTMHDETAEKDTRYGTLIDHNIVGTTHQHIYNFRLDLDVDGGNNSLLEINPKVAPNPDGGPRKSVMITEQKTVKSEQEAIQKFDPSTIRLISNPNKENKVGNPVSYQVIPFAGGTHPIAKGALFSEDEWLSKRVHFMDKQIWVTNYHPDERYPEGKYPNRSKEDTGLKLFTDDNSSIENTDIVLWMTTGATHVARAEEWPMMPTEWVRAMIKPWNFFDQTPTLDLPKKN
ncbi:stalk domain-containing protein [Ammoniphilus sp. CFH 90114]|uniref:copper amine oxidase n=1 Tax=Ammoniphilus sp. CFH 90114 TaxID=2493665 RepID=UPI00100DB902|nr:stalk domain-containing protein [Ammoniphilus sp. CFH 90114]RXT07189.1 primary-amine oxidase [Ammoniphilus sp. CFH 90114]